eukprot:10033-Eustigmatos_ZCMA.PRE.1
MKEYVWRRSNAFDTLPCPYCRSDVCEEEDLCVCYQQVESFGNKGSGKCKPAHTTETLAYLSETIQRYAFAVTLLWVVLGAVESVEIT